MQRIKARNEEGKTELSWGHPCKGHGGIDPTPPLQLTAGAVVLFVFSAERQALVCRTFFGKSPPRLNLGR